MTRVWTGVSSLALIRLWIAKLRHANAELSSVFTEGASKNRVGRGSPRGVPKSMGAIFHFQNKAPRGNDTPGRGMLFCGSRGALWGAKALWPLLLW